MREFKIGARDHDVGTLEGAHQHLARRVRIEPAGAERWHRDRGDLRALERRRGCEAADDQRIRIDLGDYQHSLAALHLHVVAHAVHGRFHELR
jgi:hypothetical protein